jgi:Trp operon repressor
VEKEENDNKKVENEVENEEFIRDIMTEQELNEMSRRVEYENEENDFEMPKIKIYISKGGKITVKTRGKMKLKIYS